jgi:hypothetical protein
MGAERAAGSSTRHWSSTSRAGYPAASLAAEAGIAVFGIAFERWIGETSPRDLPQLIRESLDELKAVTAGK